MSCRDPAVPVRWVRCCSCSRVAVPSRDPGTRLQRAAEWRHHSSQSGTPRKGDQPKDWRAPSQETAPYDRYPRRAFFLTWQASSNVPHWCPTWCRRSWYVGLWSTTASMSRYSRSWYSYAVACSVLLSFSASLVSCLSSSSACRLLVSWRGRPFLVAATPTHPESVLRYAQNLKDLAASTV